MTNELKKHIEDLDNLKKELNPTVKLENFKIYCEKRNKLIRQYAPKLEVELSYVYFLNDRVYAYAAHPDTLRKRVDEEYRRAINPSNFKEFHFTWNINGELHKMSEKYPGVWVSEVVN